MESRKDAHGQMEWKDKAGGLTERKENANGQMEKHGPMDDIFENLCLSALLKAGAEQAESPRLHGVEEKKYAGEHTWAKMKKNMSGEKEE